MPSLIIYFSIKWDFVVSLNNFLFRLCRTKNGKIGLRPWEEPGRQLIHYRYTAIYPSIYLCILLSIYPTINLAIYLYTYPSYYLSIYLYMYISLINWLRPWEEPGRQLIHYRYTTISILLSILLSIYPTINLAIYLYTYPSYYLSIYLYMYLPA